MSAFRWMKQLRKNERGNVLVLGAASMPLLIGSAALAIDTIQLSLWKRQLQRAADSGAIAGAHSIHQSASVNDAVTSDLALNNTLPLAAPATIENAPTAGTHAGDARAVRVVLSTQRSLPFMGFFISTPPVISVEATAAVVEDGDFCVISLEEGENVGIEFQGNTNISLGCGMATNSRAANGVTAGGSSTVLATPIAAMGGLSPSGNYIAPTILKPYSTAQDDPFAALPDPVVPNGCLNKNVGPQDTMAFTPDQCFKGLDIKGTATFAAGVYYIDGGTLSFGSQAKVTGEGVTFILTSKTAASNGNSVASLDMNGGAQVNLSSPTSGTYEGVLFYQDRRASAGGGNKINGNASSIFEGGFYFPRQDISMNGTAGMDTRCLQLVARRISFSGNSSIQNECPENGAKAFEGTRVRLVG